MRWDREALESQRDVTALPVVRFYRWNIPTLSYGRLQSRGAAESLSAVLGGKAVVERPTGGGMVLHDSDISFSVVWRRDHPALPPCIKNVYRLFHEAIAGELRSEAMNVSLHAAEGTPRIPSEACYRDYSQDDVVWEGQKLVGGALRVTSWGRLYQGNFKPSPALGPAPWEEKLINAFTTGVFLCPPVARFCDRAGRNSRVGTGQPAGASGTPAGPD
jgi:lipoate-protein ligase A